MTKVFVYQFKAFDVKTLNEPIQQIYGTAEAIKRQNGEIVYDSVIEINESQLDGNGFYKSC